MLASETATTMAMVLTELLQNAVEHGYGEAPAQSEEAGLGAITITARRDHGPDTEPAAERLVVTVDDDGRGLPEVFDLEGSTTLGLSIVRTLVASELGGVLTLGPTPAGRGTRAAFDVPL